MSSRSPARMRLPPTDTSTRCRRRRRNSREIVDVARRNWRLRRPRNRCVRGRDRRRMECDRDGFDRFRTRAPGEDHSLMHAVDHDAALAQSPRLRDYVLPSPTRLEWCVASTRQSCDQMTSRNVVHLRVGHPLRRSSWAPLVVTQPATRRRVPCRWGRIRRRIAHRWHPNAVADCALCRKAGSSPRGRPRRLDAGER